MDNLLQEDIIKKAMALLSEDAGAPADKRKFWEDIWTSLRVSLGTYEFRNAFSRFWSTTHQPRTS